MKKFLTLFFAFTLYFNLITQANAAVGGWALGNPVAVGASTVYEGTKQVIIDGKNYIKTGTAKITPVASQVSKVLARGAAGYALSVAVEQLLGAVDWVLDPANNQIVYYEQPTDVKFMPKAWRAVNGTITTYYSTASLACASRASYLGWTLVSVSAPSGDWVTCNMKQANGSSATTQVNYTTNPTYNPNAERERKTLPLETVAQQVISNAESDTDKKVGAQVATTAAAADIVAEAETDETKARPISDQLNKSASTKPADSDAAANAGTGTATATPQADPVTGEQAPPTDISLEFPVFCDWVPVVCEAAQYLIEPPEEPDPVDLPTKDLTEQNFLLNLITVNGAYCPANKVIDWDTPVGHFSKTVSYKNFCDATEWFGYLVLAASYYLGALIVVRDS